MLNRLVRTIPYFLAIVVVLTSLRGLSTGRSQFPMDAPRHALNGVFVYDLVRSGNLTHPFQFGKQFYSRFPAISIPYHPPLFPVIEAVFYAIFGVNLFAARLPVALAAGVCVLLLYRLVNQTHRLPWFAAVATITFITLRMSQVLLIDVMLEFPSLAFTLGALYCLRDLETGYPPSRAFPFAFLAGAAVWTKQHAVFLGLVPFLLILFNGNWRLLRGLTLWASSILFGLMVMALMNLSVPVKNAGVANQFAPVKHFWPTLISNATYYGWMLRINLGLVVTAWLVLTPAVFLAIPHLRRRAESRLYLAWILALVPLLVPAGNQDFRYLIFGLPALIVLGFDGLRLALARVLPAHFVPAVTGLLAVCLILSQVRREDGRADTAHGDLARILKDRASRRVIYCGPTVAKLALAMRFLDPDSRTIMIRGDKLDPAVFTPADFERFARRYGVDTVIVEPAIQMVAWRPRDRPWNGLAACPSASMVRLGVVPNKGKGSNDIVIFDFQNPSRQPEANLEVPISFTAGALQLDL